MLLTLPWYALSCISWAIVVRVQSEGEAKLLTATAIVSDPSFVGSICAGSSSSSSKDSSAGEQTVEAALAEGLRFVCSFCFFFVVLEVFARLVGCLCAPRISVCAIYGGVDVGNGLVL